jgi:galactokinase
MPAAIDRWICTVIKKRDDNKINIYSSNFKKAISVNLNNLQSNDLWEKYAVGCISVVKDKYNIQNGFDVIIKGNIPIGFGMSSSAAFEVSFLAALLFIFKINIDSSLILKLTNIVEKKYLGIKSGLLDQYASLFSKESGPLIINFFKLSHHYINSNIKNASWVIINSMVHRELINSKYNERVNECLQGLIKINTILSKNILINQVTLKDLEAIKDDEIFYNRLYHVINENNRVLAMKDPLEKGELNKVGELLNQSHNSLSKYYNVSCKEIDFIIKISKKQRGFYGGRIMGGGFGGCTINLIDDIHKGKFIDGVKSLFFDKYSYELKVNSVNFSNGLNVNKI